MLPLYLGGFLVLLSGAAWAWIAHLEKKITTLTVEAAELGASLALASAANLKLQKQLEANDEIERNRPMDAADARRRMRALDAPQD